MIKEILNYDGDGMSAVFGIKKEKMRYLFNRADVEYDRMIDEDGAREFNKNILIKCLLEIAENQNEEAAMLYYAGVLIGELQQKIEFIEGSVLIKKL